MESGPKTQNEKGVNTNTEWDSLANPDSGKSDKEITTEAEKKAEDFTSREMERLAKITGRVPDDEGVVALNLALRYRKYQQALALVNRTDQGNAENPNTRTMIQRETMEDIATAKRELEEAMYIYDNRFAGMDEELSRREAKDAYSRHEGVKSGATHEQPGYWLNRQRRRQQYGEKRDAAAEDLANKLDGIAGDIENSEIFKTYEWNKEDYPEENMRDRRDGLDGAGKNGLFVDGNYDWKLYPHAPEKGNLENNGNGDPDQNPDPDSDPGNKVNIDVQIKGIEQEFEEINKERIKELEDRLKDLKPDLAELYARNRRLFVGSENRAQFNKIRGEYGKLMDEYLRLKGGENYEEGKREIAHKIDAKFEELKKEIEEKITEFCGGDPEHSTKTQEEVDAEKAKLVEEAEKKLQETYGALSGELKDAINADFIDSYIKEELELEKATTDALDNGSLCRKFVNKVLNNKKLKIALGVAAGVGLAATGIGIAAGAISLSFVVPTVGAAAAGAAKGALSGTLMSRQNSKNSAVRGFSNEEEIRKQLEGIDITDKNSDEANVASYLMEQYEEANNTDRKSNRKKTLISAGIGAVIGGLTSAVQINNIEKTLAPRIIGRKPTEVHAANLDNVNIPKGHGAWDTFQQLGGRPEDFNKFQDIMFKIDPKYGLQPGSNGVTPGANGIVGKLAHTYSGRIENWPDVAQSYITEVTDEAARQGLIPSIKTGGGPIYDTDPEIVKNAIPDAFKTFLARATANIGIVGTIGGLIGGKKMRHGSSETPPETPPAEGGEGETPPAEGEAPQEVETPPAEEGENGTPPEVETPTVEGGGEGETSPTEGNEDENEANERLRSELEFRQRVADELGNSVGLEGIDIITTADDFSINGQSVFNARAESWWNNLNDEAKEVVRNFERSLDDSEREDNLLKSWLSNRGEL